MVLNLLAKAQNHNLVSLTGDIQPEDEDSEYNGLSYLNWSLTS